MKILNANIKDHTALSTDLLRGLEDIACTSSDSFKDGWRAIIKLQAEDRTEPYFVLDVQSNRGGGDYAEVKMRMLEQFPDLPATGLESPEHFASRLSKFIGNIPLSDQEALKCVKDNIAKLDWIEQMPRHAAETLRDFDLTSYKGAIRIPYEGLVSADDGIDDFAGEIRIAFSGAEEWQDMLLCVQLLRNIQRSLLKCWPNDQIWYNLRALQAEPQLKMLLTYLGVDET